MDVKRLWNGITTVAVWVVGIAVLFYLGVLYVGLTIYKKAMRA
jgi:hypothetical protein